MGGVGDLGGGGGWGPTTPTGTGPDCCWTQGGGGAGSATRNGFIGFTNYAPLTAGTYENFGRQHSFSGRALMGAGGGSGGIGRPGPGTLHGTGAGGRGGGIMFIRTHTIRGKGSLSARGLDGSPAPSNGANSGGGGGGAGGCV